MDCLAVKKLEIGGVGHIYIGRIADDPVETFRCKCMRRALLPAVSLHSLYDLVSLFPETVHLYDFFRRMLQITVDHDRAIALTLGKPCEHRRLFPEISREGYTADAEISLVRFLYASPGGVRRAVVDEEKLMVDIIVVQKTRYGLGRSGDHLFFIICGYDYR